MKIFLRLLVLAVSCLGLASCHNDNEDEVFEAVEFETTGITTLIKSSKNDFTFYAEVPAEGGIITFKPIGQHKANGFLSRISIDGESQDVFNIHESLIAEGDWGKMEKESTTNEIIIALQPNNGNSKRKLGLFFGGAYTLANFYITQPSLKN